ncbi:ADAM 17-like protease [Belonocnema kinseyi]|uniref:ADAM 17-like protease n=1 Tax=Belonocnema kinseyi TaxID=2817044 RepID=UPI00143D4B99|nr:ADAM 17-like protease [Belonocnema kinseyi]
MRTCSVFLALICLFLVIYFTESIHRNLKYYETLDISKLEHKIVKRGTQHSNHPYNKISELEFYTHGRHFRLILTPRREVIHSNFKAYEVDGDGQEKSVHLGPQESWKTGLGLKHLPPKEDGYVYFNGHHLRVPPGGNIYRMQNRAYIPDGN